MEPKPLNHLTVKGFTSIKHLDLDLGNVNVVIGPNGSGKSNFLRVFDLLSHVARQKLQLFVQQSGRASSLLYYGPKVTPRIEVDLAFDDASYAFRLVPTDDDRLVFEWEKSHTPPDDVKQHKFGGHEETHLAPDRRIHPDTPLAAVESILSSYRVYHFADSGSAAPPIQTGDLHDNERLRTDAGDLAAVLYLIQQKHEERYRLIRKTVQRAFPQFEDFALRPDPHNEKKSDWSGGIRAAHGGSSRTSCPTARSALPASPPCSSSPIPPPRFSWTSRSSASTRVPSACSAA